MKKTIAIPLQYTKIFKKQSAAMNFYSEKKEKRKNK